MSKMYFLPFRPAFDSAGVSVPGSQHYFTLAGTNTPSAPFIDAALTTHTENPVVANGIGYLDPIYLDPAISYRVRIYDADATVGVDTPLEEYDPYIPALANADIFSDLAGTDGADLVGTANGGTIQDFLDKADTKDHGQVAAGVVELWARTSSFPAILAEPPASTASRTPPNSTARIASMRCAASNWAFSSTTTAPLP
jgi:hypothetical protein